MFVVRITSLTAAHHRQTKLLIRDYVNLTCYIFQQLLHYSTSDTVKSRAQNYNQYSYSTKRSRIMPLPGRLQI